MLKIGEKFQETENIFFGIFLENFLKKFVKKRIFSGEKIQIWRRFGTFAPSGTQTNHGRVSWPPLNRNGALVHKLGNQVDIVRLFYGYMEIASIGKPFASCFNNFPPKRQNSNKKIDFFNFFLVFCEFSRQIFWRTVRMASSDNVTVE